MDNGREMDIEGMLDRLSTHVEGNRMTLGEMVEAVEGRGFGPVLLVPALLVVLPTGAIPGVPTTCAILTILVAGQLALGKRHPWLPRRLRRIAISREKFQAARSKSQPVARFIDRFIFPRMLFLSGWGAARLVALLAVLISLTMPPLELVPFAVFLPGTALLLLGLGLSARDGILILTGIALGGGGIYWAGKTVISMLAG